jgi:nucleotide-binding universal stress UspA family protein
MAGAAQLLEHGAHARKSAHVRQEVFPVMLFLPLLQAAESVRIITATDQKTSAELESGAALVSHLAEHAITAVFETVKIDGSSVGKVFESYIKANAIDLLVMGAYRHSRLNEFVWGGASNTVIGRPPCWVMMSH